MTFHYTDDEPVISDTTEPSEAPTTESSGTSTTKSSATPTTELASSTEMTQSHRYPQRNHNPPDGHIKQC